MTNRFPTTTPPDPEGLKAFDLGPARGFLPESDPAQDLPGPLAPWQELAAELPKRLLAGRVGDGVDALPVLPAEAAAVDRDRRAAMRVLSFLAHGYIWERGYVSERGRARAELPACLAVPWRALARALGRPPVLSYASYALDNWRRLDADGPLEPENLAILQNFLGGADEDWFIVVHVAIEAQAAPLLRAVGPAQRAAAGGDADGLERHLESVAEALETITATLRRMPEHCDPFIYFHRVRPFIHGWKGHPALPGGLRYRGACANDDVVLALRGETGAQSGIVPVLDALLGVAHAPDPLRSYLDEMRDYMPPGHRAFLEAAERGPSIPQAVREADRPALRELLDTALHWLEAFRATHLDYAARYIHAQSAKSGANPSELGTGGTPFMPYLGKHRDETAAARNRRS